MRFYHIDESYIEYLHSIDYRVQFNKNERRPYIGVVLHINGWDYFAPLESPKAGHKKFRSNGPILKLDGGRLGLIGFNNMVPVLPAYLVSFDINKVSDDAYRNLLQKQFRFCKSNVDVILNRARTTYTKTVQGKEPYYRKNCCDFELLEKHCGNYIPAK